MTPNPETAARIGSLCTGYGGLDLAVEAVFNAETVWQCEIEAAPSKILAAHWTVPNHGDLKTADWAGVEPVEIMTAGYPCQPFSHAGKRQGADDDRHLWPFVAEAVRRVRPGVVVLENVAGHRTLGFDAVLGELAEAGYDARWMCVRASDVGAPHGRERLFIVATDASGSGRERRGSDGFGRARDTATGSDRPVGDAAVRGRDAARPAGERGEPAGQARGSSVVASADPNGYALRQQSEPEPRGGGASVSRLPRPYVVADSESDGRHERRAESARVVGGSDAPERRGATAADTFRGGRDGWSPNTVGETQQRAAVAWGSYEPAIRRWERLTRPAPAPTELAPRGGQRLSPRFVEWMMGLPAGWVTDVPISRNEQLKALGNGVVPQQAVEALRRLLSISLERVA